MSNSVRVVIEQNDIAAALRGLLRQLLDKGIVDALLVPVEVPSGRSVVQSVVTDAGALERACPLAPVMPVNSAAIVGRMTRSAPGARKLGVVLRSCELRALVELVKLKQADLTNIVTIGIDCFGTYRVQDYAAACADTGDVTRRYLQQASRAQDALVRQACRVCTRPAPLTADIEIGLFGQDLSNGFVLTGRTEQGEAAAAALGLPQADTAGREAAIRELYAVREQARSTYLADAGSSVRGLERMLQELAPCVACHNCRVACPICYCRECLLDSPTITEWEGDKYFEWSEKKGALRMPGDTLLFHLVRMHHMAASCVTCGQCADACPNGIDVFKLFCLNADSVQRVLGYRPGAGLDDALPMTAFEEDEFKDFEN